MSMMQTAIVRSGTSTRSSSKKGTIAISIFGNYGKPPVQHISCVHSRLLQCWVLNHVKQHCDTRPCHVTCVVVSLSWL